MPKTDLKSLITSVQQSEHFATNFDAIEAIQATLRTVAECLPGPLANELALQLPEPLARSVRCENWKTGECISDDEFAYRVALREKTSVGCAREYAFLALFRISRSLSDDLVSRIRRELPDDFAAALTREPSLSETHMHQPIS